MKYYMCKEEHSTIVIVKEIAMEDYLKWKESTERLQYYNLARNYKMIAIKNGIELCTYLKMLKKVNKVEEIRKINTDEIGVDSNRLMLNYLVSFRTYVDILQACSHHMKRGKEFEKNILNWMYDNEQVYAFFSKLRNFATHYSMVFDSIAIEKEKIILECSKEHLLEYKEWKAKNISYINECKEEYLPILDYVEHNNVLMQSIYMGFINYFGEDIQEMHNQVMLLMREYKIINPFFIKCEDESDLLGADLIGIGLDVLKQLTDEFAELPNVHIDYVGSGCFFDK